MVEGSVELFGGHNGHETTIDIIRPVTTFILAAVIRDEVYLKSARTLKPAQILMIPAQTVRDVFGRDAAFARAIVNELAVRYRASCGRSRMKNYATAPSDWPTGFYRPMPCRDTSTTLNCLLKKAHWRRVWE